MKKTILITGSSSGLGRAAAEYFHDKGWNVVATMRRPEKESELNIRRLGLESFEQSIRSYD
jgi:NAD(P)-dependent dehydrogenase (short-subunit alcohol dehydrogenase family)